MPQDINRLPIILISLFIPLFNIICFAEGHNSFPGRVNSNNINIRCDSTISSGIICQVNKNEFVEVVLELYDWYKIRLPKQAPSFIKKNLVSLIDEKSARVIKDNVNIRLEAEESSAIVGKAKNNEVVNILRDRGEWYKIEPVINSFGWIHKKFVDKVTIISQGEENKTASQTAVPLEENIVIEGVINPKFIKRVATHKLITKDNKLFLLRGNKEKLNPFNYRRTKVTGKLISSDRQKNPVLEVERIEALD